MESVHGQARQVIRHGAAAPFKHRKISLSDPQLLRLLALASLILAFAFIATAPAAPNKANVPATSAANTLPATPAAAGGTAS